MGDLWLKVTLEKKGEGMEKLAIVTGSTHNVGKGIAEILSEDGFLVIVTSRNGNEAREVAERLPQKGISYEVDFSDVRGQEMAKRALIVAAAGGHNILMLYTQNIAKSKVHFCQ